MNKTSHPYFVAYGLDRETTAILLLGTAEEAGLDPRSVRSVKGGFRITQALSDVLAALDEGEASPTEDAEPESSEPRDIFNPADYNVGQVKAFVTEHPDLAEAILASEADGKNRVSLVEWLRDIMTSGNDAVENADPNSIEE